MTAQLSFWLTGLALTALILKAGRDSRSQWSLWVGASLAPILLISCLWSARDPGDMRVRILAASMPNQPSGSMSVGGDAQTDDIVFGGLPGRTARLRALGNDSFNLEADLSAAANGEHAGVVDVEHGGRSILGAVPLAAGDLICVARCADARPVLVRVRSDESGLEPTSGSAQFPTFGRRTWLPTQAIYPLREYGKASAGLDESVERPCERRFLCRADGLTTLRTFIYRACRQSGCLRIVLLDSGLWLQQGQRRTNAAAAAGTTANPDTSRIRFYAVSYGSAYQQIDEDGRPPSRLVYAGGFEPRFASDVITLGFMSPETVALRAPLLERAARRDGRVELSLVGAQAAAQVEAVRNPIVLDSIGGRLGENVATRISLGRANMASDSTVIVERSGPRQLGTPFEVNAASPRQRLTVMIERVAVPKWLPAVAVLWAIFLAAAVRGQWSSAPAAVIVIWVAQWLLAIRLLVGFESVALDPGLTLREGVAGNIAAYASVPLLILVLCERRVSLKAIAPALVFALGIAAIVLLEFGASRALMVAAAASVSAAVVVLLRAIVSGRHGEPAEDSLDAQPSPMWRTKLATRISSLRAGAAKALPQSWLGWALFLALIAVGRGLLLLLGIRERFPGGIPIAVNAVYLPLVLVGFAGLFLGQRATERDEWLRPLAYAAALLVTLGVVPWLVSDNGLVIYALPVAIVALLASARSKRSGRALWNAPALLVGAAALLLFGWQWLDNRSWSDDAAAAVAAARYAETPADRAEANRRAAALVQATTTDNANLLRLWTAIAPQRISDAGSSEAESQKRVAATLREYSSSLWGRGYMAASQPGDVRRYQADDNLSAVHVMSPFGRLGAAILVLALAALAWRATTPIRHVPSEVPSLAAMAGVLAAWTLLCTAAYMILCNLQWMPFTGRNVYLLAALSVSDLVEGTILLLMTAGALSWRPANAG